MKTIALKVTSAFLVAGKIAKVGDVVEVGEADAKSLLHRGKAVLAAVQAGQDVSLTDEGNKPAEDGALTNEGTSAAETGEAPEQPAKAPAAPAKANGGKKAK